MRAKISSQLEQCRNFCFLEKAIQICKEHIFRMKNNNMYTETYVIANAATVMWSFVYFLKIDLHESLREVRLQVEEIRSYIVYFADDQLVMPN